MNKNIIITGATGFIGSHLTNRLVNEECNVYAVVRPGTENISRLKRASNLKIIELDMADISQLYDIAKDRFDCFYHLAWNGTKRSDRANDIMQKENYINSISAYETAGKLKVKTFIVSGSQSEYGSSAGILNELSECNPNDEYGKYKLKTLKDIESDSYKSKIRLVWFRIFSAYGMFDNKNSLIMSCIDKMKSDEPIELKNPNILWDYINVNDVIDIMLQGCKNENLCGIYNIAQGQCYRILEYVDNLKKNIHSNSAINGVISGVENQRVRIPSIKKINNDVGWSPRYHFEKGIVELLKEVNQ